MRQEKMAKRLHYRMNQCKQKLLKRPPTPARHLNTNRQLGTSQSLLPQLHRRPRRSQWSERTAKMSQIAEKEAPTRLHCLLLSAGLSRMGLSLGLEELVKPPAGHLPVHKFPTPRLRVKSRKNPDKRRRATPQPTRHPRRVRRRPCPHQ
jgi:hypothetical protein